MTACPNTFHDQFDGTLLHGQRSQELFLILAVFLANVTGSWPYTVPDGGREEIQCVSNNTNGTALTIQWVVFGKVLEESINSCDPNFKISRNSSLIVTNPRDSSLQGLVNITCITSSNRTNDTRTTYIVAFLKGKCYTCHFTIRNN